MDVLSVDVSVATHMTSKNTFAHTLEKNHMVVLSVHSELRTAALLKNTVAFIAGTVGTRVRSVLISAIRMLT